MESLNKESSGVGSPKKNAMGQVKKTGGQTGKASLMKASETVTSTKKKKMGDMI
jgi:hypothetical protein